MQRIGSQIREKLEETDYWLVRKGEDYVILTDGGPDELWVKHDDNPGYTIEVDGAGYEFTRSLAKGEANEAFSLVAA